MDSPSTTGRNPSIPAPLEPVSDEYDIHPHPEMPFEERHPELIDYQPDLTGKVEGDQSVS